VIISQKGSENALTVADKGLSDSFKNLMHSTSHLASETTHTISSYFKKGKSHNATVPPPAMDKELVILPNLEELPQDNPTVSEIPITKEPLG